MAEPDDLGPQLDPTTMKIGKEYYYYVPSLGNIFTKVVITNIRVNPAGPEIPYTLIHLKRLSDDSPLIAAVGYPHIPWESYIHKFFEIRNHAQIQAQTNVLRNLGRYGKIPMNVSMGIGSYLGLGGKRKLRRKTKRSNKRSTRRRR
jgi:hypothetical protein